MRRPVVDEYDLFARDVDDVVGSTVLNHVRADHAQSVMFAELELSNASIRRRRADAV